MRRARLLSWRERRALAFAFAYLAAADAGLRCLGFRRLAPRLRPAAGVVPAGDTLQQARFRAWAVSRAARIFPGHPACLPQAVAVQLWLRRDGIPAQFHIGVDRDGAALLAHAWVEVEGQPVTDPPGGIARFAPIFTAAPPSARPLLGNPGTEECPTW